MPVATKTASPPGLKSYYQAKIEAAELLINQKTQNLRRLEAQRNALNARGATDLRVLHRMIYINDII
jgi:26S proteasome regulatory subunit T6